MLKPLERPKTLKEAALESLRNAITLGEFAPGERLVERVLSERLGVSRTVVRECVRHLESERLVTTVPNAGPSVARLKPAEVAELYDIRAMIESEAIRACARRADKDALAELKTLRDAIQKALAKGDVIAALEDTTRFYEVIFLAGGKPVSWDLVERLNGRIGRLRAMTLMSKGRAKTGPANLTRILDAIAKGDARAAGKACEVHIAEAKAIALQLLKDQPAA